MKRFLFCVLFLGLATSCTRSTSYAPKDSVVKETYYHQYGMTLPEQEWHERGMNGEIVRTLDNGVTITKSYFNGILHGKVSYTFPHSSIIEVSEEYLEGELIKRTIHYASGTPKTEEEFLSPVAKLVTAWYEDGIPLFIETYEEGKLIEGRYFTPSYEEASIVINGEGTRIFRDCFGQILSTDLIEKGEMVQSTIYHLNGSPKTIIPYVNGKIDGLLRTFYPGGDPITVEEWKYGFQEGITLFFENGQRVAKVPYHKGMRHGIEKRFREEDKLVEEITWENGKRQGPAHIFVEGSIKTEWYFEDQLVSKASYDVLKNPSVR